MKISCKVIEDILPLYVDECCSEDTKLMIEKHLLECETCKEKLIKLRQPIFLPQEPCMDEKTYAKHAKRAFGKLRRRWIASMLIVLIILVPLTWLGVNEVRGEGVNYSNLTYVLRGNSLLRALKNGNYEKAFSYLNLKAFYEWEIEYVESDEDLGYTQVTIGDDIYYINEELYTDEYRQYLMDEDEAAFWRSLYLKSNYMIPASKAELYLNDFELLIGHDLMEYVVDDNIYYIDGKACNYNIKNAENNIFTIMPEVYYNQIIELSKEAEKEGRKILQQFIDMGYDGYVADYKQQWINKFKHLKEEGITIVGYKITDVFHRENGYQMNFQLKLNDNGKTNYDYGITFIAEENGYYPSGGSVSGVSMEDDKIPIIGAFGHSINYE